MELNSFITKILTEISTGITNANKVLGAGKFGMEPYERKNERGYIMFDVAVTTTGKEGKTGTGSIGIQVLNLGGKVEKQDIMENSNRIRFYIIPTKYIG